MTVGEDMTLSAKPIRSVSGPEAGIPATEDTGKNV